jgi:protoporphyrinogen IX oxidase
MMQHIISYDLARGLHIIAVIALMAGLLMQPRFYAYISGAEPGGELDIKMLAAAKRLRTIILGPALVLTWAFGIFLFAVFMVGDWDRPAQEIVAAIPHWFWAKLILVLGLSWFHAFLVSEGRSLERGERRHTERFWRMISEIPFLVAIVIVLLATLEP